MWSIGARKKSIVDTQDEKERDYNFICQGRKKASYFSTTVKEAKKISNNCCQGRRTLIGTVVCVKQPFVVSFLRDTNSTTVLEIHWKSLGFHLSLLENVRCSNQKCNSLGSPKWDFVNSLMPIVRCRPHALFTLSLSIHYTEMVGWKNSSSLKSPSPVVPGWWQNGSRWNANVLFEKNRAKKREKESLCFCGKTKQLLYFYRNLE